MPTPYLSLATLGKNQLWRYLLGLLVIVVFWQFIGALPILAYVMKVETDDDPSTRVDLNTLQFEGVDPLWPYLGINFTLIAMFVGLFIAIRFLHQRAFKTAITPLEQINWKLMWKGFSVYFLLMLLAAIAEALLNPSDYTMTFDFKQFMIFLPLALIITPIQAAAEEVLFRGYIMQGLGLLTRYTAVPVIGTSLLFMLAHFLNPEMKTEQSLLLPLLYFLLALFLAVITVKSNSLELAIGVHAANNLFTVLIMNYANSALPAPSIFTTGEIDPLASLISFVLIAAAFYWIVFVWKKEMNEV